MASNIQPTGLDWKNLPQKTTPISAENLNKMANTIDDLVEAVNPLNTVEANPTGTPTEGLEKVEIDGTLYEVKGGHKILNDSGTTLAQKDNLQFKGVYTQNNGDNTEVDICRTMTKAQMEALSGEALKGFINTSDEPDSLPLTAEWVAYDSNTSVKDKIDDIDLTSGGTISGNLDIKNASSETALSLGGGTSNSVGRIRLYDNSGYRTNLVPKTLTSNREIKLPNENGVMVVASDSTGFTSNYVKFTNGYPQGRLFDIQIACDNNSNNYDLIELNFTTSGISCSARDRTTQQWSTLWSNH